MKKILIIEDDPSLRNNISEFLKEEGFEAHAASDGSVGVQLALEVIPNLILCDISMPKMDGYEVLKTLKIIPATSSIPFIFLTAKTQKDEMRLGMQLGVDDYITKPFSFDELLASINVRIEKHERVISTFENRYLTLVENPLVGVFIMNNFSFRYMNTKFVKILGFPNDMELYKVPFEELIMIQDKTSVMEKMVFCQKNVMPQVNIRCRLIGKNKEIVPVSLFASSVKLRGEDCIIGYIQQQQIEQSFELNGEKSEYLEEIGNAIQQLIEYHKINPEQLIGIMKEKNAINEMKNPDCLTKREIEIIKLLATGLSNKEIADKLFISQRTVDTHKANILMKTSTKHVGALVMYSLKNNIIDSE